MKARFETIFAAAFAAILICASSIPAQQEYVASVFTFGHGSGTVSSGATRYLASFDGASATANNFRVVMPRPGTLKNLYWAAISSTLTGSGHTITVLQNGVATSLSATWNANAIFGNNTSSSVAVAAGDVISVRIVLGAGTGNMNRPTVSFELVAPDNSASPWIISGSDIYYNAGRVGIGTASPQRQLHLEGSGTFDAAIRLTNTQGPQTSSWMVQANNGAQQFTIVDELLDIVRFMIDGSGRVGIGTLNPQRQLHIEGNGTFDAAIRLTNTQGPQTSSWMIQANNGAQQFTVVDELINSVRFIIDPNGDVGIGTLNPGGFKLYVAGTAFSTGGWSSSDLRFKENLAAIQSPLQKVMQMRGVAYNWKTKEFINKGFPDGRHFGLIAQEIEQVLPEVVQEGPEGDKAVAYDELIPILIEAIKEQQRTINTLVNGLKQHGIKIEVALNTATDADETSSDEELDNPQTQSPREDLPTQYKLSLNYPNPFNPTTMLKYALPQAGQVTIKIYDALGREVKTLVDEEKAVGYHTVFWDGKNQAGEGVAAGSYICRMQAGDFIASQKLALVK
jgi:hypothetical protein